jgi:hypothetical protein
LPCESVPGVSSKQISVFLRIIVTWAVAVDFCLMKWPVRYPHMRWTEQKSYNKQAYKNLLHISRDAGHFLCDFIYFSSLAYLFKRDEQRRVVFLHVPSDASKEAVARGKDVALRLIGALVESELELRKVINPGLGEDNTPEPNGEL